MRDWRLCANSQLSSISARAQVDKLAQDVGFETIFPLHLLTILCSKLIIILNKVYSLSDCLVGRWRMCSHPIDGREVPKLSRD